MPVKEFVVKMADSVPKDHEAILELWEGRKWLAEFAMFDTSRGHIKTRVIWKEEGIQKKLKREGRRQFGMFRREESYAFWEVVLATISGVIVYRAFGNWRHWKAFYHYLRVEDAAYERFIHPVATEGFTNPWTMTREGVFAAVVEAKALRLDSGDLP